LVGCLVAAKIGGRDRCIIVVQRTPVPAGDHRPLRVAVSPVPAELSWGRGVNVATRCRGQLRNHPAVVCEVRAGLRQPAAPAPGLARRQMASRWSLHRINGTIHHLWRAVGQHGNELDVLVQSRRNAVAAKKFFRRPRKGLRYVPRVLVTEKLASYGAAHRAVMSWVQHRQSTYLNNRAENSHQPARQRERAMNGSPRPRMRNGSCPRSAASRHISVRVGICCRPPDGATRWPTASPSGTRSPGLPRPPP